MALLRPHALQVGSSLGRYTLTSFLGEGGFAEVWLARDPAVADSGEVAIKIVRRGRVTTAGERAMFLDEAKIAAGIRHPNVARVLEIADQEGLPYLVMEHVSGGSLEAVIEGAKALDEPIPIAVAVTLLAETCAGLHAAHELAIDGRPQHVVHRDISPQNVLITSDGIPKLIDFGIAKARERMSKQTSTGITKGKIAYMAPEQARGAALDRRADIWSVGIVLFEMLEGRKALGGPNEVARLQGLVSRPLRLTFSRTPAAIASVIKRATAFEARDRPETADELRRALEGALMDEGLTTTAAAIADFCQRARVAADLSQSREASSGELARLLPRGNDAETVSAFEPIASPRRRARRAAFGALGLVAVIALGGLARVVLTRASADAPSHSVASASAFDAPPSALLVPAPGTAAAEPVAPPESSVAAIAPSVASVQNTQTSHPRSTEPKGARAGNVKPVAKGKPARRPSDYAQIE